MIAFVNEKECQNRYLISPSYKNKVADEVNSFLLGNKYEESLKIITHKTPHGSLSQLQCKFRRWYRVWIIEETKRENNRYFDFVKKSDIQKSWC